MILRRAPMAPTADAVRTSVDGSGVLAPLVKSLSRSHETLDALPRFTIHRKIA